MVTQSRGFITWRECWPTDAVVERSIGVVRPSLAPIHNSGKLSDTLYRSAFSRELRPVFVCCFKPGGIGPKLLEKTSWWSSFDFGKGTIAKEEMVETSCASLPAWEQPAST